MTAPERREAGLKLIIVYKLVKGTASLVFSAMLLVAYAGEHTGGIHDLALALREHVARAWAVNVAELLIQATEPARLLLVGTALSLDGILTFVEGFGLQRGWRWASWLVVIASGSLLPLEIVAMARKLQVGRAVVFVVNLAIVIYLVRRTLREHRVRAAPAA